MLLAVLALFAAANPSLPTDGVTRLVIGHLVLVLGPALAGASCFRAAKLGARRAAPTWWLIGTGAVLVATGQAIWFVQQVVLEQTLPFPSLSFYLFIAFHPLFAIGVLRSLRARGRSEPLLDIALDALLASAAIAAVLIRFVHEPLRAARPGLTYVEVSWIVSGQFLTHLSLVAVGVVVILRRSMLSPRAVAGLAGVAIVNSLANLLQMASLDPDPASPGDAFDLIWLLAWSLLAWAGLTGASTGERVWSGHAATWVSARLRQSVAPIGILVLAGLTIDVMRRGDAGPELFIALIVLGLLLAVRMARAVGAVERENRERRELERTRVLVELSRTFAAAPRVENALAHVLTSAEKLLSTRRVWIERIGEDGSIQLHAGSDVADTVAPLDGTAGQWLGERRYAQKLTGERESSTGPEGAGLNARVWLAAGSIRFGPRIAGTLIAERDVAGFDADELELLGALADQAAVAIENARLIDEARRAERRRLGNEKLVSLGNLVAGVAHEINNPLTAIQSAADLLASGHPDERDSETLEILRSEAVRAGDLVRRMLDFIRPDEGRTVPTDVASAVYGALKVRLSEHERMGVRVNVRLDELPLVFAEPGRLHQVFLNLIVNAEHALAADHGPRTIEITGRVDEMAVNVEFRDNGCGIPADQLDRVFDPFFTTKAPGAGTGLGLSLSHGILRDFGGTMTVNSTVGVGTSFTVQLPVAPASLPDETASAPTITLPASPAVSSLSILVVEDEASIRTLVRRYLRRRGHEVETADNGRAALAALERRSYDVIVTDMKMPEMGGEELYSRLCDADDAHAQRVLFISGDTVSEGTREFLLRSGRPFVSKPFDLDELAARISETAVAAGYVDFPG
jgi:signal transduction histidine kinase/CheY-like chemotaxis protein